MSERKDEKDKIRFAIQDFNEECRITWLLKNIRYNRILKNLNDEKIRFLNEYLKPFDVKVFNDTPFVRKLIVLCQICNTFDDMNVIKQNFKKYYETESVKEKLELKFGKKFRKEFSKNLSNIRKEEYKDGRMISPLTKEHWMLKGFTEEEANLKLKEISDKKLSAPRAKFKGNVREINPFCLEYWMEYGYNEIDGEQKRKEWYDIHGISMKSYINKYGEEEAKIRMDRKNLNRHNTLVERYGTACFSNSVSKVSLKFFEPLYEKLILSGFKPEDICWGIKGTKEFVINDTESKHVYFYDFTIKSLKLMIEFNGVYWHPRLKEEWRRTQDFDEEVEKYNQKISSANKRGFDVHIVWEDDDFVKKQNELFECIIKRRNEW